MIASTLPCSRAFSSRHLRVIVCQDKDFLDNAFDQVIPCCHVFQLKDLVSQLLESVRNAEFHYGLPEKSPFHTGLGDKIPEPGEIRLKVPSRAPAQKREQVWFFFFGFMGWLVSPAIFPALGGAS